MARLRCRSIVVVCSLVLLLLAFAGVTYSQVITGTILGTVIDRTGLPVRAARVTIVNSGTNVRWDAQTDEAGNFERPSLPPGTYEVSIEAPGFKTFRQSNVNLQIDSKYRVNASMELGQVTESVTVVANVQVLQTDQSDLNTTVSQEMLEAMPNIGRNPMYFVLAAPGVARRACSRIRATRRPTATTGAPT